MRPPFRRSRRLQERRLRAPLRRGLPCPEARPSPDRDGAAPAAHPRSSCVSGASVTVTVRPFAANRAGRAAYSPGRDKNAIAAGSAGRVGQRFDCSRPRWRQSPASRAGFPAAAPVFPAVASDRCPAIREIGAPFDAQEAVEPRPDPARERPEAVAVEAKRPGRQQELLAQDRPAGRRHRARGSRRASSWRPEQQFGRAPSHARIVVADAGGGVHSSQAKGAGSRRAMSCPAAWKYRPRARRCGPLRHRFGATSAASARPSTVSFSPSSTVSRTEKAAASASSPIRKPERPYG